MREKQTFYPRTVNGQTSTPEQEAPPPAPENPEQVPTPGKYPCPCCGFKTLPVPKEDALDYICPVCFWENDVFTPGEDQPSDENRGMTLSEGRAAYRSLGAVCPEFLPHVRPPLPAELP